MLIRISMSKFISQYQNANELSELTLGKTTSYISEYTPNLLQGVPRSLNRDSLQLKNNQLPFIGEDVWYGYEVSWLNLQGKPVVAVAEFRFPCTSQALVESKSFKLYLNSFNQSRFASKYDVVTLMIKDLSAIAGETAKVQLFDVDNCPALAIQSLDTVCIDDLDITIDDFAFNADLLAIENSAVQEKTSEQLVSHLLKSNCLITNQPDWATIYIDYQGQKIPHENLLKYLISFRQHNEFHEQCVERIFTDLMQYFQLEALTVFARYTRRGGLDINPFRSTHLKHAPLARTLRQ